MEVVRSIPLYYVAMPQSMVIVTKVPFVIAPTHIVVNMRSKPQTPRETQLVNVHIKMPIEVDMIFIGQPLDARRGSLNPPGPSRPPRPLRYFGLPMMNLDIPPLPPNRPYHQLLNYPKYVKDSDPNVHVKVFKATIRKNGETDNVKFINLFNFTLKDIMFN
jgi:hypothetical protein